MFFVCQSIFIPGITISSFIHSKEDRPQRTIFLESVVRVKINSLHKLETYDLFFTAFLILAPVRQHGHVVAVDTSSK